MALITISEYAKKHGVKSWLMRERCQRGCFKTARKMGDMWFIDEDEVFIDHRRTTETTAPARRMIDPRFRPSWDDEFLWLWPDYKVCSNCVNIPRPRWLDLKLEEWDLLDVPHADRMPVLEHVIRNLYCERCAEKILAAFRAKWE